MKNTICILFICITVSSGLAYTYEVYTYGSSKNLKDNESILIDQQGGMYELILEIESSADILGTSDLMEGSGGIWQIQIADSSTVYMAGGEVHRIDISQHATAELHGGLIQEIWSYQDVPYVGDKGGPAVPVPYIKLYYSGSHPTYNDTTHILTGLWGSGNPFSIYLHDVATYDPVIENIEFILVPEPLTLFLFGLGALLARKINA